MRSRWSTTYPIQLSTPSKRCVAGSGLESCCDNRTDCVMKFHCAFDAASPASSQSRCSTPSIVRLTSRLAAQKPDGGLVLLRAEQHLRRAVLPGVEHEERREV